MQTSTNANSLTTKENNGKLSFNIQEVLSENKTSKQASNESNHKKQNICHICHKPFSTLGNMRNHIITIHENYRPFKCTYPFCNKGYSIESRYQVHLRTHIGAKPFLCQICNKSFNEKGNLKTHLRFHSELRPFKCPHCTKCYKTNGHLKDHIEIQHNLIKKYFCQYCNKKFGRISTLKAHIRTHTGEKKYKCKMEGCDKWFAEKGNMEIHYKRHLRKLNKVEIDEKKKKKYGEKDIEKDYEEKIKEAIDKLKDINKHLNSNKINDKKEKENNKKVSKLNENNKIFLNNNKIDNISNLSQRNLAMNNFVNNSYLYNINLNNVNILSHSDKINNFKIINETNFNQNINNMSKNFSTLNNYSNHEQNCVNNENQNFFGCLAICPIIPEFQPIDQLIPQENKIENLFNKDINEINIDISNCMTRPNSNITLYPQKKPDEIFAKEEDLFSAGEDFSKVNNSKNNNDNIYPNENNINFNQNYEFLYNQQCILNEERMNNFNYNLNDLNEAKNPAKFPEQLKFLDKNYII